MKASSLAVLLDRPIAFHRPFADITGSINAALMLSQALYWSQRTSDGDGWFYKTRDDWHSETALTRTEQETARRALRNTGFWEEELRGVPAKIHYRVNLTKLASHLEENLPTRRQGKPPTSRKVSTPTSRQETCQPITEITSETTTETTSSSAGASPAVPELILVVDETKPTIKVWEAYSTSYQRRYHVQPVRNQRVNGQIAQFVKRLGAEDSPHVAAFYLTHNGFNYLRSMHSMNNLLSDCEKLRTEWITGRKMTTVEAKSGEQKDAVRSQAERVREMLAGENKRGAA